MLHQKFLKWSGGLPGVMYYRPEVEWWTRIFHKKIWFEIMYTPSPTSDILWRSFILKYYNAKKFLKLGWHSGMVYNQPDMGRWTDNKELSINSTGKRDSISFAPLCWVITVIPSVHRASKKPMSAGTNCWLAWPQLWVPPHRHGTVLDVS